MYEDKGSRRVMHSLLCDGFFQWKSRCSDLVRAFDLLSRPTTQ